MDMSLFKVEDGKTSLSSMGVPLMQKHLQNRLIVAYSPHPLEQQSRWQPSSLQNDVQYDDIADYFMSKTVNAAWPGEHTPRRQLPSLPALTGSAFQWLFSQLGHYRRTFMGWTDKPWTDGNRCQKRQFVASSSQHLKPCSI